MKTSSSRLRTALREFDWKGWLGWMMATVAGVQLVVVIVFFYFAANLDNHWWGDLAMVSVAGVSLGACQWIWLRRRLVKAWWWIVSTLSGWYLALFLVKTVDVEGWNATGALAQLLDLIEALAVLLALSLPQWFLIQRQFQKAAWWWIVARPLAWLVGLGLVALGLWLGILPVNNVSAGYHLSDLGLISIVVVPFGLGFAAVTGAAFTWIQKGSSAVRHSPLGH